MFEITIYISLLYVIVTFLFSGIIFLKKDIKTKPLLIIMAVLFILGIVINIMLTRL